MDPDDLMSDLRAHAMDTIARNSNVMPTPPRSASQGPAAPADFSSLPPAPDPGANDCEFTFIGGAGVSGPYLDSFKKAFEDAGIEHVKVPNQGAPSWSPHGAMALGRLVGDLGAVPGINDLAFAKSLVDMPAMKAAAQHSRSLGDEQYNLGGYSYGAAGSAAGAYAIAENGGKVDNLVLLGAPINQDLYDAVRRHPNIKNVITLDLGSQGDPVHAGMSDVDFAKAFPTLMGQMKPKTGHFYYSGAGPVGDARRDALARSLVARGVQ